MTIRTFFKAHRRIRRLGIAAGVAFVLFTLAGFLVIPAVAKSIAQRKLSELLHRQVTIAQVRLNPYALSVTVRGLVIRDRDGSRDLFKLGEVYVNLGIASVFKGGAVVQEIRLIEPEVNLVRTAEDRYNFSDIIDDLGAGPPAPPKKDDKPARFSVSNIQLVGGHMTLDDRWKNTRHEIAALNISVPFISNFPYLVETFVQPAFSAVINGTKLAIDGRTKPFADSLESTIDVNLLKVDLPYYLAYVPVKLRMKVRSAVLDTRLKVTFVQYRDRAPRVDVGGSISLSSLDVVDELDRPLLKLPLLDIDIGSSDLLSSKLSLRHVWLQNLALHVRKDRHGDLQFSSLVVAPKADKPAAKAAEPAKTAPPEKASPWLVELEEFKLDGARVAFSDASNGQPFETTLDPLNVKVTHFTTGKDHADVDVDLSTDAHERLSVRGKLGVDPVVFDGTLTLKDLRLPRFSPYYASQILFDVKDGKLDLTVPAHVAMKGKNLDLVLTKVSTELRDLQLRRRGDRDDFLRLPSLAVRDTNFNLDRKELVLGDVSTSDARIRLERAGANQPWNLQMLVPAAEAKAAEKPSAAATEKPAGESPSPPAKEDGFAVTLEKLDLRGWSIRVDDRAPRTPAVTTLDRLGVHVEKLGTSKGKVGRVTLQARLNQSGAIDIGGSLGLAPLQGNLRVQLKAIPVIPTQPYFQDEVAMLLTSGRIGLDGHVGLVSGAKGPVVTYKGEISADDFVAVSRAGDDELARLGNLRISGIDLVSEPFKLNVGEIALRDYAANVVIQPDKTINLATVVPAKQEPAKPATVKTPAKQEGVGKPTPEAAPLPVRVGAVVLSGGNISVEDRSTHPAFAISLSQLGGKIANLSFSEAERATVQLAGKLGNGPLAIDGQINPLAPKPYINLTFNLSDLDLSAMTPYSGKYAGYAVERGQLYLDLKYLIDARKLDASNNVKLSQFTFGQAIDSKDATHLPVRLAVSLLKDRHGVIQLDVPVSGSLDDPKFSVWGVVLQVVENLLIKAATSPFALIGSLFGQGEELAYLEFEPGRAEISAKARTKLETLSKALFERPALHLEVEGHASPSEDTEALRKLELERKVRAQKVKLTVSAGDDAGANVTVSAAEYSTYLKRAYEAEPGINKPKNALGMLKSLPVADMERLMLGAIAIGQDDLRLLARQRAQVARDEILRKKNIEPERVFVLEPKSIAPEHKEKLRDSRVDFRLQ